MHVASAILSMLCLLHSNLNTGCDTEIMLLVVLQDMFLFDWATMPVQTFAQKLVTGDSLRTFHESKHSLVKGSARLISAHLASSAGHLTIITFNTCTA